MSEQGGGRGRGGGGGGLGRGWGGNRGDRGGGGGGGGGRGRGGNDRGGFSPRGNRGDRGNFRGSSGGRGDGDRGGRGGGGFRGDRGGGGGGFRGDGGGRGGFRGGPRGGGGGGRGGRAEDPTKSQAFSIPGIDPNPDVAITKLENQLVATSALTGQMAQLSVKGKGTGGGKPAPAKPARLSDLFPARPAFGSKGRSISVWANYFSVKVEPDHFYRYTMEVKEVKDNAQTGNKSGQPREVRGRKLQLVIKELLALLLAQDKTLLVATEFKDKLVTMKKLELPSNPVRVEFREYADSDKVHKFDITINGPFEVPVDSLKKFLTSMDDGPNVGIAAFPRYPDIIDSLNVIFGFGPRSRMDDIAAVGSSRFFSFGGGQQAIKELTHNWRTLAAMRGYFQSARIGTGRLLLNTNVTHGVFRLSGKMTKIFDDLQIAPVQKKDGRGLRMIKAFAKFLPKARVRATFKLANGKEVSRVKSIYGLAVPTDVRRATSKPPKFAPNWEYAGPKQVSFHLEDDSGAGKYITVFDYFRQKYGANLGDYPLLNLGSADKPTYFPAEFVELDPGQAIKASLSMDETTAMLEFACRSPYSNALSISTESREVLGLDEGRLGDFGISVDKHLLSVQARVLNAPMVSYLSQDRRQKREVAPQNGSWNMRQVNVFKPGKMIQRWTWINILLRGNEEVVDGGTVREFGRFLNQQMGIAIARDPIAPPTESITRDQGMTGGSLERLFEWLQQKQIQLVVVVLSDKDSSGLYAKIKTLGDCTYGIHTSCVVAKQFRRAHPAYFANVGLKVNLKGGGTNHKLSQEFGLLKEGKTMIVGYDVTHPTNMPLGMKKKEPPSLVGFVSSIDSDLGQWPAVAWEQASRQEMLSDRLSEVFMSRLDLWQKHNGARFPENIVIFRDGVSEGQFAQVIDIELASIRDGIRRKCPPTLPQPKLTLVVSVKRHHTRFYPQSAAEMSPSGNIKNGTVVDRGVTQVRYWDFFLAAHDALQGTTRPAHYTVLLDEIFRSKYGAEGANELERMTHELCYTYGRATKAVSLCPPAYYADIVCERARAHRPEYFDVSDTESVTTAGGSGGAGSVVPGGKQVHDNLKDSMYYI